MNNSIYIKADIILNPIALKWVASLPLKKDFRTSFWLENSDVTCPCEIQNEGEINGIDKFFLVIIMLPKLKSLEESLFSGCLFKFGLKYEPIGNGKIIKILKT